MEGKAKTQGRIIMTTGPGHKLATNLNLHTQIVRAPPRRQRCSTSTAAVLNTITFHLIFGEKC